MKTYRTKNIALWILLVFFSKMAFAIVQPLQALTLSTTPAEMMFSHQHEEARNKSNLLINSHCQHDEGGESHSPTNHHNADCNTKCDCCIGHCNTPALFITGLNYSDKHLQHVSDQRPLFKALPLVTSLFRPPILG
jgi:hypothetical protein